MFTLRFVLSLSLFLQHWGHVFQTYLNDKSALRYTRSFCYFFLSHGMFLRNRQILTCLFLSSVIRWIWIFFLPMMLCSYREKRCTQSRREVRLKGWERKCSLLPLTSAQKHSETVIHTRTHAGTYFSAQMWQCHWVLLSTDSESEESICGVEVWRPSVQ